MRIPSFNIRHSTFRIPHSFSGPVQASTTCLFSAPHRSTGRPAPFALLPSPFASSSPFRPPLLQERPQSLLWLSCCEEAGEFGALEGVAAASGDERGAGLEREKAPR